MTQNQVRIILAVVGPALTHLCRLQISRDPVQVSKDLVDERLRLPSLLHDKVSLALLGNLDERITSHVLHTCGDRMVLG